MKRLLILAVLSILAAISIIRPPTPSAGKFSHDNFGKVVTHFDGTLNSSRRNGVDCKFVMQKKMVRPNGCGATGCIE